MKKIYGSIIALFIGCLVLAVVLLNFDYFWQQFKFRTGQINNQQPQTETVEVPEVVIDPNYIFIPSLEIVAPISYVDEVNETVFQKALQNGIVHYPGTAQLGEYGNAYLFGHSSDSAFAPGDYKTVFALLPEIENGAEIYVSNAEGKTFRYQVFDQFVVESADTSVLNQRENKEQLLSLQTSYPLGTALRRYVVVARLIPNN